jgi:hypothetical protein
LIDNLFNTGYLGITFIKSGQEALISKDITLQNDQQAYQKHQNGNFVNDVHGFDAFILRPARILFSKEVPSYFTQLKEIFEPVSFILVIHR